MKLTALLILLLAASPATAAPIPRHLFPPNTEPKVGWRWVPMPQYPNLYFVVRRVDGDLCYIQMPVGDDWLDVYYGKPLTAWEVRQLMRGEEPDLSRLRMGGP